METAFIVVAVQLKRFWTADFHVKILYCSGVTGKGIKFVCLLWSTVTACML